MPDTPVKFHGGPLDGQAFVPEEIHLYHGANSEVIYCLAMSREESTAWNGTTGYAFAQYTIVGDEATLWEAGI